MASDERKPGYRPEESMLLDGVKLSDDTLKAIGDLYTDFYTFRSQRSGEIRQLQYQTFEDFLKISRELFWNSTLTQSDDLRELGLDFSFPFVRKEVLDFLGRISSLNIAPQLAGEGLSMHGVKVLQAIYKKWRTKSNDRVEKFWETLYGIVNGTVCLEVAYDGKESLQRFLKEYDPASGEYKIEEKKAKLWDDVRTTIVPLEEMYLAKVWERNIQLQGKTIRLQDMSYADFCASEHYKHPLAKYVKPGNQIAEDSLFFQLLSGMGIDTGDNVQVLTLIDTHTDRKLVVSQGIPLNMLGKDRAEIVQPIPFHHKMQPYVWSVHEPIDNNFAYGLSMPFKIKDGHKLLNTSYTMLVESELRGIDPPYLTSDIEAPSIIFGKKKVIPVMDVNAYKPIDVKEGSNAFYGMMNSLQGVMTSHAQGGSQSIMPSKQPKAAREIIAMEQMKQDALGNALVMYFDMVSQELKLMLKTALQFYPAGSFAGQDSNIVRALTIPDFPLSQGGVGRLEARIVKKPQEALALYFEAVKRSMDNGRNTEIIEYPAESLSKLVEFSIMDITLEPEKSSELEKAAWSEQVLAPLIQTFIPMGLADPAKVFLRWAEKNNESVANFASDKMLPQMMAAWGQEFKLPDLYKQMLVGSGPGGPAQGAQTGNLTQSTRGTQFGSQSNGGIPGPEYGA
jgi:hypothetical protein